MERLTIFVHEYVTGGGLAGQELPATWAAEGSAMRRAIAADLAAVPGTRVVMTLDERLPDEPGRWQVERVGIGAELSLLTDGASRADAVLVIAPETGGVLAERERMVRAAGGRSLGSTPAAIERAADKLAAANWLAEHGVPVVSGQRVEPGAAWPADRPAQAVLKPIDGAGSLDTHLLGNGAGWPAAAPPGRAWLLQPYLPGEPVSLALLVQPALGRDPGRFDLVGSCYQHVTCSAGRFRYQGGSIPAPVPEVVIRTVVTALGAWEGLQGWVGVDLMLGPEPGSATVLEVNPRLTTSYVGLRRWVAGGGAALARRLLKSARWDGGSASESGGVHGEPGIVSVAFRATGECQVRRAGGSA